MLKKNKANFDWNCSKASLCRQDMYMNPFLNDAKLEEAIGEKLLGIRIIKLLNWNLHIDYVISKLNSRISLLKKSKIFRSFDCRILRVILL